MSLEKGNHPTITNTVIERETERDTEGKIVKNGIVKILSSHIRYFEHMNNGEFKNPLITVGLSEDLLTQVKKICKIVLPSIAINELPDTSNITFATYKPKKQINFEKLVQSKKDEKKEKEPENKDVKGTPFISAVVDSKHVNAIVSQSGIKFSKGIIINKEYHVTLNFGSHAPGWEGKTIIVTAVGICSDEKNWALVLKPIPEFPNNKTPHITLAFVRGSSAMKSGPMIGSGAKIQPLPTPIELECKVEFKYTAPRLPVNK